MWSPGQVRSFVTVAAKYGGLGALGIYLAVLLAGKFDDRLAAAEVELRTVSHKLDAHNKAMEGAEAVRQAEQRIEALKLKGICYGVTEEGSQARSFCEAQ